MHVKHLEQRQARRQHSRGGAIFIMSTTVQVLRARKALLLATMLRVTTRHKKELVALAQGHRACPSMTGDPSPVRFPRLQNRHQLMKPAGGSGCTGQRSGAAPWVLSPAAC